MRQYEVMQSVLSIDVSTSSGSAVVVQIDGKDASVQEIHQFDPAVVFGLQAQNEMLSSVVNGAATPAPTLPNPDPEHLRSLLHSIKTPWTSSILIVPPKEYISMNLDLPFASNKGLDKIVNLEVQDLVPFDLDEFLLHYRPLGPRAAKNHDIHVGLVPRSSIASLLGVCKAAGFEPFMVSTPPSVLGAIPFISPEKFESPSAIVSVRDSFVSLVIVTEGRACMDRVIDQSRIGRGGFSAFTRELKLFLATAEQRYGKTFQRIYTIGLEDTQDLSGALGVTCIPLSVGELVKAADSTTALACLASVFAQDLRPPPILANFRVKEFAYSPQLRELAKGLRSLVPFFLAASLVAILSGLGVYSLRERRIHQMKNAIRDQIKTAIPALDAPAGLEVDALEGENRKLESQLSTLGSLSALSPLDYFSEISADLPVSSGISVTRVKIEGNKLRVDGTAPDYAATDKIERGLKKKKNVYCRIRNDLSSVAGKQNSRGFSLDIVLCD